MKYHSFEDREVPGDWRVEAIDPDNKAHITIFTGPQAEERAVEYAAFKNGVHPSTRPVPVLPTQTITVSVQDGRQVILYLPGLRWTWDQKRKTVTAHQKDLIEPVADLGGPNAATQP